MLSRIHWPAVVAAATTLGGVVTSPIVLGIIPAHWAAVLVAVGSLGQAVTKAVHDKGTGAE